MKNGILFHDWSSACNRIAPLMYQDSWYQIPFSTADHSGDLLTAFAGCDPEDVVIRPGLTGWHRIYVCMMVFENNCALMKLSSDTSFHLLTTTRSAGWDEYTLEEGLWRCADLTGEALRISHRGFTGPCNTLIAWLRFVPMTGEEVAAWKSDFSRREDKRLYANDDMHNKLYGRRLESMADWATTIDAYRDSDVEWVSMENMMLSIHDSLNCPESVQQYRVGDVWVTRQRKAHYTPQNAPFPDRPRPCAGAENLLFPAGELLGRRFPLCERSL